MPIDFLIDSHLLEDGGMITVAASHSYYRSRWQPAMQALVLNELSEDSIGLGLAVTIDNKEPVLAELRVLEAWISENDPTDYGAEAIQRIKNVIELISKYIMKKGDRGVLG